MLEFFYWLKNEVILIYGLLVTLIGSCRSISARYEACSKNELSETSSVCCYSKGTKKLQTLQSHVKL